MEGQLPQALKPRMTGQAPKGEGVQIREGSGVWIRHSKCEIHMGHLLVMLASRREFWAGEGEQGCLNLPEQSVRVSRPCPFP